MVGSESQVKKRRGQKAGKIKAKGLDTAVFLTLP